MATTPAKYDPQIDKLQPRGLQRRFSEEGIRYEILNPGASGEWTSPEMYDGPVTSEDDTDPFAEAGSKRFYVAGASPREIAEKKAANKALWDAMSPEDRVNFLRSSSDDPSFTWARNRGLQDVLAAITYSEMTGKPIHPGVKAWLEKQASGTTPTDQWSNFVRSRQDKESGPSWFGIDELGGFDADNPFSIAIPVAATVFGGPVAGSTALTAMQGADPSKILESAALAFLGSQIAGGVSNAAGGGTAGSVAGGSAAGGTQALLTGGDPVTGMLSGGISGGTSSTLGGGPIGNAAGQIAGAAATDQDMAATLQRAGIGAALGTLAETNKTDGYDLGGGLSVDASGAVTGGMFESLGVDDIAYEPTPVNTDANTYQPTPIDTFQGAGLTPGRGGAGLRLDTPAPGLRAEPDATLGADPLSFVNTGGTPFHFDPQYSLANGSGEGLRLPQAPNLESMGGAQGITVPTNSVLGDPQSFVNSPEVLAAVRAGTINENGMLPTSGAALGDPTSPINAGTFAQPGAEMTPGMLSSSMPPQAEEPAPAGASKPVKASVFTSSPQPAPAPAPAARPAAPAPAPKIEQSKIDTILARMREAGVIPAAPSAPDAKGGVKATATDSGAPTVDGVPTPQGAPAREKGQSDAEYSQALVNYLNTALAGSVALGRGDPEGEAKGEGEGEGKGRVEVAPGISIDLSSQHLADLGLTPGSAEYYDYIMSELDAVLSRLLNGLDPDDASFGSRVRAKTRGEMDALLRVLYVRGVIGQLMGSGRYADPFTGIEEDVIAPEGKQFNPAMGAYHRGLARSVEDLRAMGPQEARRYLGGMLDRKPDLYNVQAKADARRIRQILASLGYGDAAAGNPMKKRQRGMLGESNFLQSELGQLSERELQAVLGDAEDPQAALQALLNQG